MNGIDWEALKKVVADNEKREVKASISGTGSIDVPNYSLELNGVSIDVEVKSKDTPNNSYAMRRRLLAYC